LKLKHPSTHTFPDLLPARGRSWRAGLMPFKLVPNAAETAGIPMTEISDFVQQSHNSITLW
jgi:hypothetical protein